MHAYKTIFKPLMDFLAAATLIIILFPIILAVIVLLTLSNNGSVFFLQSRPGYKAIPFKIIKFKTMRDAFDDAGNPLSDKCRITKVGLWVRSLSIDEILQLFNVLKGDMSLVGPRPLLMQYIERYSLHQAKRHEVKPGITGWAQVNGRNAISWEEKFKYDVEYVEMQSFMLDIKILCMTFINVIHRKGVSADGHVTMEEFKGSKKDDVSNNNFI